MKSAAHLRKVLQYNSLALDNLKSANTIAIDVSTPYHVTHPIARHTSNLPFNVIRKNF